ncbi:MAG TPA: tetratricopeptide repeat protein [Deltaproteobacteria bacterium]|nr:tetratricopeptide repeat protein [Deltaproteobacteria bacterium]
MAKRTAYEHCSTRVLWLVLTAVLVTACGPSLAQRKKEADIHYRMGIVHLSERHHIEALKELTRAVESYPDDPSYHNALGLAYFALDMDDKAEEQYREAIRLDPGLSEAHVNLGALLLKRGAWDEAIAHSEAALENVFYPTPELAHNNMGWALYSKGEYRAAEASFKKALIANPDYAMAYNNLGMTYDRLGESDKAVEAFSTAVAKAPGFVEARFNLAKTLAESGDREGAIAAFEKVMEIAPESDKARLAAQYLKLLK